jgi:hypothetical protein
MSVTKLWQYCLPFLVPVKWQVEKIIYTPRWEAGCMCLMYSSLFKVISQEYVTPKSEIIISMKDIIKRFYWLQQHFLANTLPSPFSSHNKPDGWQPLDKESSSKCLILYPWRGKRFYWTSLESLFWVLHKSGLCNSLKCSRRNWSNYSTTGFSSPYSNTFVIVISHMELMTFISPKSNILLVHNSIHIQTSLVTDPFLWSIIT